MGARKSADGAGSAGEGRGDDAVGAIERCFTRTIARFDPAAPRAFTVRGRVRFDVGAAPGWTLEVAASGRGLRLFAGDAGDLDAVVEATAADLAAVLTGRADANELFHQGRIRLRGNVALVMQVVSAVSC